MAGTSGVRGDFAYSEQSPDEIRAQQKAASRAQKNGKSPDVSTVELMPLPNSPSFKVSQQASKEAENRRGELKRNSGDSSFLKRVWKNFSAVASRIVGSFTKKIATMSAEKRWWALTLFCLAALIGSIVFGPVNTNLVGFLVTISILFVLTAVCETKAVYESICEWDKNHPPPKVTHRDLTRDQNMIELTEYKPRKT